MYALCYTSTAVRMPTTQDLEGLLVDARDFNAPVSVTGALLVWDQSFFHYFEGPDKAVDDVYERNKKSRLHHGIIQLLYEPMDARQFKQWHMGFSEVPRSEMLALAHRQWESAVQECRPGGLEQPAGVTILLQFWRNSRRLR